jgi:hypothetical protein
LKRQIDAVLRQEQKFFNWFLAKKRITGVEAAPHATDLRTPSPLAGARKKYAGLFNPPLKKGEFFTPLFCGALN